MALDIDGTLLDPGGHVTTRVRDAVRAAVARGILVTLCTGRPRSVGIRELAEELGLSLPVIVRNGTCVQDAATGKVLYASSISNRVVRSTLDVIFASETVPVVEEGPAYGERLFAHADAEHDPAFTFIAAYWARGPYIHYVEPEVLYTVGEPTWIGACGTAATTHQVYIALQQMAGITCAWTGDRWTEPDCHLVEALPPDSSKAAGLRWFAAEHGIPLADTLAVGDDYNDIELLSEAGWGVAMGQASAALKAVANAVVPDDAHDGAAVAIERYALATRSRSYGRNTNLRAGTV